MLCINEIDRQHDNCLYCNVHGLDGWTAWLCCLQLGSLDSKTIVLGTTAIDRQYDYWPRAVLGTTGIDSMTIGP